MLNYYIATMRAWETHVHRMADSHWFEHGGDIVLCAKFHSATIQDSFESQEGVIALPHLMELQPVGKDIASRLSSFGVVEGDTTWTVAKKLAKQHPAFDPRVF